MDIIIFSPSILKSSLPKTHSCPVLVTEYGYVLQSSQTAFQEQHINGPELGDEELFSALNDDMPDGIESMNDFSDIFNGWSGGMQSPGGSPGSEEQRRGEEGGTSRPGSPGRPANHHGAHSPMSDEGNARVSYRSFNIFLNFISGNPVDYVQKYVRHQAMSILNWVLILFSNIWFQPP